MRVTVSSALFVAEYTTEDGVALRLAIDPILMTLPPAEIRTRRGNGERARDPGELSVGEARHRSCSCRV
jgi:hypothetical protein